jgi:signal peptidase I
MNEVSAPNAGNQNAAPFPGADKSSQGSLIVYTLVALGLALFIRFFIAAPYIVQGASMMPTFQDLNYLIIDRVTYNLEDPQRGDVVVFDLPHNESRALIKRVVGLPGETILIQGNTVTIVSDEHPQGFQLDEPYVSDENYGGASNVSITLSADEYFVLGDNRKVSADSRVWGALPREEIVGRVFVRLFPFGQISFFPGVARYEN